MNRPFRNGMSKLEIFLMRRDVISGTLIELENNTFETVHNYRRLLLLALAIVISIRFGIILIFYNAEVRDILGDVLWTIGTMGYFITWLACTVGATTVWYLIAITYCEYKGELGFLNDLSFATQMKSDFSISLNAKMQLLHEFLVVNALVIPYVNGAGVLALCTWKAYQVDHSIRNLLYYAVWNLCIVKWGNLVVVVIFSISALVYLSTSVMNYKLTTLCIYLKLCKDPFTLNRIIGVFSDVIVKVNLSNKFVKFVLGSVNFLAVPMVSICLSIITVPSDGAVMKCLVFTVCGCVLILLVSTAAYMASVHYNVSNNITLFKNNCRALFENRLGDLIQC